MCIKKQLMKLKENWLLILLLIIIVGVFSSWNSGISTFTSSVMDRSYGGSFASSESLAYSKSFMPAPQNSFAPDVAARIITKSSSLSMEVANGAFTDAETKLKSVLKSSDSFLLNENVNTFETGWKSYKMGTYNIKVETSKYTSILSQLKELGKVSSFNENTDDITASYTDLNVELAAEKERLSRYQKLYDSAQTIADKIELSDRISNQERTIKYYEKLVEDMNNQVSYSSVYLTISEKTSPYSNIIFVKFSSLVNSLVDSINSLLSLIFVVLPWAVAIAIIALIVKLVKKNKKSR